MTNDFAEYLTDLLAPWDRVTVKAMFGGHGLYRRGLMFAILDDDTLYFKVSDANRGDYEGEGMRPFTYTAKGKKMALSYWQVPLSVLEDAEQLAAWAEKAYQVAVTAKSNPKKRT